MTTQISFELQGATELAARFKNADAVLNITLNEGLRKIGRLFVPAKGVGPLAMETPKRTGKLARSTYFRIMGGTQNQWLEIHQPAMTPDGDFYGGYVREGTPAHVIRPRNAKALRFEMGGRIVFAMKVNHPGTRPNPYHKRVMMRLQGGVNQIVRTMGVRVTAYLSGR